MNALAVVIWLFFAPTYIHDHWINGLRLNDPKSGEFCCGTGDCFAEKVWEYQNYVIVQTGEEIPTERVIWRSQDGQWWRCQKMVNGRDTTRCLIGPPRGL